MPEKPSISLPFAALAKKPGEKRGLARIYRFFAILPAPYAGRVCVQIDLTRIDDEALNFDEELTLDPERLDENQVAEAVRVRLHGIVRNISGRYRLDGSIEGAGKLLCTRCLAPVPWRVKEEFSAVFRPGADAPGEGEFEIEDSELDVSFLGGELLDLNDVAAEQLMLALPMRIVCDEACAGLCPQCGGNRNVEGACRCEPEVDPRWDELRGLSDRGSAN